MKFSAAGLASLATLVSAKYKPTILEPVEIHVSVEHIAQAIKSDDMFKEIYRKTEDYNKESNDVSFSTEGSVAVAGVEASRKFSAAYVRTTESKFTDENKLTVKNKRVYREKDQILRRVETTTTINNQAMIETTLDYVNVGNNLSMDELRDMSVRYVNDYIIQDGGSRTTNPWKTFGFNALKCKDGDIMIEDWCYDAIRISVEGRGLSGYDGVFAPTPEVYLQINDGSRKLYKGYYSETYNPNHNTVLRLDSIRTQAYVQLKDHDDEGSDDLMCYASFRKGDLLNDLRRNKGSTFSKSMSCLESGRATVYISAP